jgi:hypothetical protein
MRPDLPLAAEQIILRALAKRPADRYPRGQELATAFSAALAAPITQPALLHNTSDTTGSLSLGQTTQARRTRGLFDPSWQTEAASVPSESIALANVSPAPTTGLLSAYKISKGTVPLPTASLLTDRMSPTGEVLQPLASTTLNETLASTTTTGSQVVLPLASQTAPLLNTTTGALDVPNLEQGAANTIKLTGPVKVVQIPIAGQPGRYVTGLLPVPPQPQLATKTSPHLSKRMILLGLVVAALLILGMGTGAIWYVSVHSNLGTSVQQASSSASNGPNLQATAAQATANANANVLLVDPLSQNIHNWPDTPTATANYAFIGGTYHITNLGNTGTAVILPSTTFTGPIGYTLRMQEIKGDDTNLNNSFGMIFRSGTHTQGGKTITTFYSFEVVNIPGGEYRLYKYDDSQASSNQAWTELWHVSFGNEFHEGQGPKSINTIKIFASGSTFTFTVNGKKVGQVQDRSFASGGIGMLVNLKGTEVAFSDMLITRN